MSLFLTRDEKKHLSELNRIAETVDGREDSVSFEYANRETAKILYRDTGSEFSDEEAERLAEAGTEWFGLFVSKPSDRQVNNPDRFTYAVLDIAEEETCLSAVVILEVLEITLKERKTLPSIAEMRERLEDRNVEVIRFANACIGAEQEFHRATRRLSETYNSSLESIRAVNSDFPNLEEIKAAWEAVFEVPFGVKDTVRDTKHFVDQLCSGLEQVDPWPVVPLLSLFLFAQLPERKWDTAIEFVEGRRRTEGMDGADVCDPPELWREAVAADLQNGEVSSHVYDWANFNFHEASLYETNEFYAAEFGKEEPEPPPTSRKPSTLVDFMKKGAGR